RSSATRLPPLSSTEPHVYATNTPPRQSRNGRNPVENDADRGSKACGVGLRGQEQLPAGVGPAEGEMEPVARRVRLPEQGEARFLRRAVLLLGVALPAGGDDVLPRVQAPAG